MQITITEALSKLKNINARIAKETSNTQFITTVQAGKVPVGFKSVDEFIASAKSSYQSITDLFDQKNKLKSGIVASNAVTKVIVAGKEYTVASAIERKTSIESQKSLLSFIVGQTNSVTRDFERKCSDVQDRLDKLLVQSLGTDTKNKTDDVTAITDSFMSRNEFKLVDPLNVKVLAESLSNEINDFLTNVDVALSISNATTVIEI